MAQQVGQLINPVLNVLKRLGGSARPGEVCDAVIIDLGIDGSPLLDETLKSGGSRFENKIAWVRLYLVLAGYIDRSKRGVWRLAERGRDTPPLTPAQVNALLIDIQRQGKKAPGEQEGEAEETNDLEEEEAPEAGDYQSQLLALLRDLPPKGFEQLCQFLFREAGFDPVIVTGRSGDGGIDGIGVLKVNPFVAFKVLFQCKRYAGTVSSSEVRDFRGAMQGRADKRIILTTGKFSGDAKKEAVRDGVPPIELIDEQGLIALCESLEFGLIPRTSYDVDAGFFTQFRQ